MGGASKGYVKILTKSEKSLKFGVLSVSLTFHLGSFAKHNPENHRRFIVMIKMLYSALSPKVRVIFHLAIKRFLEIFPQSMAQSWISWAFIRLLAIILTKEAAVIEEHMRMNPEFFSSVNDRPLHLVFKIRK